MNVISEAMTIDGMMNQSELEIIQGKIEEYYSGGNTLEIGAYQGRTSYLFAHKVSNFAKDTKDQKMMHYLVDVFAQGVGDWDWGYVKHTKKMLLDNMGPYKDRVHAMKGFSLGYDALKEILDHKYDMVFIDGDHRYPTLLLELCLADFVTNNIMGHDYGHPGVTRAVDAFCKDRGYKVETWGWGAEVIGLFEINKNPNNET